MILGITGGTGCGKTTLLNCIREQGGVILDCDAIYHQLLQTSPELLSALRQRFPDAFEGDVFRRKKLGAIVFQNPTALADLNRITHTAIKNEVLRQLTPRPSLAGIDAIALIESGLADLCDTTVAVTAPENVRIQRLMERDGISAEYAASRIHAQKDESWFAQKCSYVLHNDGTKEEFQKTCLVFLKELGIVR